MPKTKDARWKSYLVHTFKSSTQILLVGLFLEANGLLPKTTRIAGGAGGNPLGAVTGLLGGLPIVGGIAGGDPISAILGLVTQLLQTVLGLLGGAGGITNALPIGNIGNIASGATGALPIGNIGKIAGGAVPSI
ncbi:hypothetical protein QR680_016323 [Steinernema hermaphroditum]|uniref:Uncharacterized protein n=1 Tax=Steinernema hermaphroditum TaxID=289476 RepID=A0AA39HBU0_9BILA|nr:hypothetical protein QR680_016323 [Steinernema hermaphroditum]